MESPNANPFTALLIYPFFTNPISESVSPLLLTTKQMTMIDEEHSGLYNPAWYEIR